jgi:hypothetical protein
MSDLIERSAKILSRWFGEYDHLKNQTANPDAILYQDTFAGFIYDNWREAYDKKMQEPDIRQKVEDQIKMEKSWKVRRI